MQARMHAHTHGTLVCLYRLGQFSVGRPKGRGRRVEPTWQVVNTSKSYMQCMSVIDEDWVKPKLPLLSEVACQHASL